MKDHNSIYNQLKMKQGFTLIEVMIALFLIGIGFMAITSMFLSTNKGHDNAMRITEASLFMSSEIDRLLSEGFDDPTLVAQADDYTSTEKLGGGNSHLLDRYVCTYSVEDRNGSGGTYKFINITISWNDRGNNTKSITSSIIRLNNDI